MNRARTHACVHEWKCMHTSAPLESFLRVRPRSPLSTERKMDRQIEEVLTVTWCFSYSMFLICFRWSVGSAINIWSTSCRAIRSSARARRAVVDAGGNHEKVSLNCLISLKTLHKLLKGMTSLKMRLALQPLSKYRRYASLDPRIELFLPTTIANPCAFP